MMTRLSSSLPLLSLCFMRLTLSFALLHYVIAAAPGTEDTIGGGDDVASSKKTTTTTTTTLPPSSPFSFPSQLTSLNDIAILHDGHAIPLVGLGVALTGDKTYDAVTHALWEVGYRLVDTASHTSYGNEDQVGAAVREYEETNTSEGKIIITTKLWDADKGFYQTLRSFDRSYDALNGWSPDQEDHNNRPIDLYMMHSPFRGKLVETWDAMLLAQRRGYVISLGVSNFGIPHLQALMDANRPLPTVNQIEMHPLVYKIRLPLIEYCRTHSIHIQAYGSLLHGYDEFLQNATSPLAAVAKHHPTQTHAQILLRWALQHEFLVIPKSRDPFRILENAQLFDFALSPDEMQLLDGWGDDVPDAQRNIYEEDWGWNPIDDAVHEIGLGRTHYWPDYEGVKWDDEEEEDSDTGSGREEL